MLHKFHYSSNHRREIPIVIHRPIRCSTRDLYLAVSNFFLRRRNRNPDGKKENEPKPSHFKPFEGWTTAMRSPALARLQYRALSGLTSSPVRLQSQHFLARRCASTTTAALRSPIAGPAYQTVSNRQWQQRRYASANASAV